MKRKLALLLAVVMTMTMMPTINVFASSTNKISNTFTSVDDDTLLYERTGTAGGSLNVTGDVGAIRAGANLTVEFDQDVATGTSFRLTLSNASWFFRANSTASHPLTSVSGIASDLSTLAALEAGYQAAIPTSATDSWLEDVDGYNPGTGYANYNTTKGVWVNTDGKGGAYRGVYARSENSDTSKVEYLLGVYTNDSSIADVIITSGVAAGTTITIPMVILTDDETAAVTVQVADSSGQTGVSPETKQIVLGVAGGTVTTIKDVNTGRDTVTLGTVIISETRTGTIGSTGNGNWTIRLDAPTGYKFSSNNVTASAFGIVPSAGGVYTKGNNVTVGNLSSNSRRFDITFNELAASGGKSSTVLARIEIEGLEVEPVSSNTWGDITGLKVSDYYKSNITDYTFTTVVGKRLDYGVSLTAADASEGVPTLYTGVYATVTPSGIFAVGSEDDAFKLMEIKIKENSADSWWTAGRNTKLVLPEGVTVLGVSVTDGSKLKTGVSTAETQVNSAGDTTGSTGLIDFDKNEITIKDINNATGNDLCWISLDIWVSISNRMAGNDITVEITGGGMAGDALPDPLVVAHAVAPVTVETKVSTVAVGRNSQATADIVITEHEAGALADSSQVRVALVNQYGSAMGSELQFVNADFEVTEGDLDIDPTIGSSGSYAGLTGYGTGVLTIDIDADSTEASTITISNIRVSTATTLPTSEKEAYKILVYGSAIAENFDTTGTTAAGQFTSILKDAGVFADYAKTTSASDVGGFDPTRPFVITTDPDKGDIYYEIDGERYGISPDMYPRNENGTVLLSVRLVAEAFGCRVDWDPNKKVATIVMRDYPYEAVQFTAGSSYFKKTGTDEQLMIYADGTIATADIYEYEGIGRMYVPLRFLGFALGVGEENIWWDGDSSTAGFNR